MGPLVSRVCPDTTLEIRVIFFGTVLYVGKEVVKKGIAMEGAPDQLIELIKENGRWKDPEPAEETEEVAIV